MASTVLATISGGCVYLVSNTIEVYGTVDQTEAGKVADGEGPEG